MAVGSIAGAIGGFTAFPQSAVVVCTGLRILPKAGSHDTLFVAWVLAPAGW